MALKGYSFRAFKIEKRTSVCNSSFELEQRPFLEGAIKVKKRSSLPKVKVSRQSLDYNKEIVPEHSVYEKTAKLEQSLVCNMVSDIESLKIEKDSAAMDDLRDSKKTAIRNKIPKIDENPAEERKAVYDVDFKIYDHPPACPICKEIFTFRYQLQWHFQWKHRSEGRLFVCGECNSGNVGESSCSIHTHRPPQSSKCVCEICGVCFETDLELRRHHLTHKTQRSFVCKMCSRSFTQKPNLERHCRLNCGAKSLVSDKVCRICFSRRSFMVKHPVVSQVN